MSKQTGGIKSGQAAVLKRTGIHALLPKQVKKNSQKGIDIWLKKLSNPEYRKLHAQKIRYAKWKKRFDDIVATQTLTIDF